MVLILVKGMSFRKAAVKQQFQLPVPFFGNLICLSCIVRINCLTECFCHQINIFLPLHPSFDLQAADTCFDELGQTFNQIQILHSQGIFSLVGSAALLSIAGMKAQPAHLCTGAAVAGAVFDCLAHQALSAVADTQCAITEDFNFNSGLDAFPDHFNRGFTRQYGSCGALFLHELTAGRIMNMHLSGTMHLKIRIFDADPME